MRKLFAVAGLSLLKTWKDKLFLIIMIATALVFTSIAGFIFGESGHKVLVPVSVADHDDSELSRKMVQDLRDAGSYQVTMVAEDRLYQDVRQGNAETGFIFPHGFEDSVKAGNPLRVAVVSLETSRSAMATSKVMEKSLTVYLLERAVEAVAERTAGELGISGMVDAEAAADRAREAVLSNPAATVEYDPGVREPATRKTTWAAGYSLGVYVMFTMFTVLFQSGDILQERKDGTWGRLLVAPVSRSAIIGGKTLGAYAVGLFQVLLLFLFGRYLFRTNFGSNIWGIVAILALTVLVVTGLGLFLSTLVRTTAQLQAAAPIVIVATCMLGGCYWPLEIVSPAMRTLAKVTPQAWAMTALTDVVLEGKSLASTWTNLLALVGFGVLFFVLGASRVKFE